MKTAATVENIKHGEELSHFAELLFLRSSTEWHWGVGLEMLTGFCMVALGELWFDHEQKLIMALVGFAVFAFAYYLRFQSEDTFDLAETMRRQAAMSEGLGWPINPLQFAEWKGRAGRQMLATFRKTARIPGFYATTEKPGPRKLLDITLETAFWTRKLYKKLRTVMWMFFIAIIAFSVLVLALSFMHLFPIAEQVKVASSIFLLLPGILIFDLLDWIMRLNRIIEQIKEVELDMERLEDQAKLSEAQVMRLVSEFNCIVTDGFPIHPKLYTHYHDEIQELWDARK